MKKLASDHMQTGKANLLVCLYLVSRQLNDIV